MNKSIRHAFPKVLQIEIASNQGVYKFYINSHIGALYPWEIDIFTLENRLKFTHMKQVSYNIQSQLENDKTLYNCF